MTSSQKPDKKRGAKSNPHTEKSTMTEPQEEFIEPKGRPSKPDHPPRAGTGKNREDKKKPAGGRS